MSPSRYQKPPKRSQTTAPGSAPGELRIVQALLNTEDLKAGTDALSSPQHLSRWLAEWRLVSAGVEITRADLERALAVRAGLRALLTAHWGSPVDVPAVRRLDEAVDGARAQVRFRPDGSTHYESADFAAVLGHLAAIVVATRLAGLWDQLKICANPGCRAVFYDFSNRRTTKWCTRSCCGLMKARTYRRRKRSYERSDRIAQQILASSRES